MKKCRACGGNGVQVRSTPNTLLLCKAFHVTHVPIITYIIKHLLANVWASGFNSHPIWKDHQSFWQSRRLQASFSLLRSMFNGWVQGLFSSSSHAVIPAVEREKSLTVSSYESHSLLEQ